MFKGTEASMRASLVACLLVFIASHSQGVQIRSADGLVYYLQSVGEYILVDDGDYQVQARFSAGPHSKASIITAAAAKIGDYTFNFRTNVWEGVPFVWIDGLTPGWVDSDGTVTALTDGEPRDTLTVSGSVTSMDQPYTYSINYTSIAVYFTAEFRVGSQGTQYMRLDYRNEKSTNDRRGLLGSPNNERNDDLTDADGNGYTLLSSVSDIYDRFAKSWQVTGENTLLIYWNPETVTTMMDDTFHADVTNVEQTFSTSVVNEATEACELVWPPAVIGQGNPPATVEHTEEELVLLNMCANDIISAETDGFGNFTTLAVLVPDGAGQIAVEDDSGNLTLILIASGGALFVCCVCSVVIYVRINSSAAVRVQKKALNSRGVATNKAGVPQWKRQKSQPRMANEKGKRGLKGASPQAMPRGAPTVDEKGNFMPVAGWQPADAGHGTAGGDNGDDTTGNEDSNISENGKGNMAKKHSSKLLSQGDGSPGLSPALSGSVGSVSGIFPGGLAKSAMTTSAALEGDREERKQTKREMTGDVETGPTAGGGEDNAP